jgi:Protein of unknown function (DUF1203)
MTPFRRLFALSDAELASRGARRRVADSNPGFPCRVSLADAELGETLLLVNYEHQPANSPYRATHAIFVRENAEQAHPEAGEIPESLQLRLLSVRAFDSTAMLLEADVVEGRKLEPVIERMFANAGVAYLHLHNAKPGCYAARVDRA